jgi:hypothetical protein
MVNKPPNLSDPAERAAYRRELKAYLRRTRLAGLVLVAIGAVMLLWPNIASQSPLVGSLSLEQIGLGLAVPGWTLLVAVIIQRARYHRRRVSGAA